MAGITHRPHDQNIHSQHALPPMSAHYEYLRVAHVHHTGSFFFICHCTIQYYDHCHAGLLAHIENFAYNTVTIRLQCGYYAATIRPQYGHNTATIRPHICKSTRIKIYKYIYLTLEVLMFT